MRRNRNPCTLLVGWGNGAITIENGTAVPQKLKMELARDPENPLLRIRPKESKAET